MTKQNKDAREMVAGPDPEGVGRPRPACRLTGTDGNVFSIIGKVRQVLRDAGQGDRAGEFVQKAFGAKSYDEGLALCADYVDVD